MDLKAVGYFISTISVFLLAAVAWPGADEPRWHLLAVIGGTVTSIGGMGVRYLSHRKDRKDIHRIDRKAEQS